MTEAQWLASSDPRAMLRYLFPPDDATLGLAKRFRPSDRKLLLFCYAWRWAAGMVAKNGEEREDGLPQTVKEVHGSAVAWAKSLVRTGGIRLTSYPAASTTAALLREVVGNPFRPVTLPEGPLCFSCAMLGMAVGGCYGCDRLRRQACPYLTPDVLAIANRAYGDRLPDGSLDPATCRVLSDALEEAGCAEKCPACTEPEELWYCKRCKKVRPRGELATRFGLLECGTCLYEAYVGLLEPFRPPCATCKGSGHVPSPLLEHLRSPGPHYRGCWAVDLILGKN